MATRPMGVWGIDLGQCALKAIRLELKDDQVVATAFEYIEHPKILSQPDADPDELIREALTQFLSRNSIRGDVVAISVPGQSGLARFVKLPPVNQSKIADIVKFEAKQQIPFPLEEVVWDFQPLSTGEIVDGMALETEIGLFAMKRDMINRALHQFKDVDIEVHLVQMAPLSLCNFVAYDLLGKDVNNKSEEEEDHSCIVALEIGTDSSNLVITDGGRIIWQRPIPIGGNHFTRALTKEMKLTFAKAEHLKRNAAKSPELKKILGALKQVLNDFVGEVQRSLGYFTNTHRNAEVQYMVGLGNAFRLPGLQKFLQEKLQLEVRKLSELKRATGEAVTDAPIFAENILTFSVAYGLALQGLKQTRLQTNLLPYEVRLERLVRGKKPWMVTAAAALLFGLSLLAFARGMERNAVDNPEIKKNIDKLTAKLTEADRLKKAFADAVNKQKEQLNTLRRLSAGVDERFNWQLLYDYVNATIPQPNGDRLVDLSHRNQAVRNEFWLANPKAKQAYAALEQAKLSKPGDVVDEKARKDEQQNRKNLIQINLIGINALYSEDLGAFFRKLVNDGNSLTGMTDVERDEVKAYVAACDESLDKANQMEIMKKFKEGWVVELRGYTYHEKNDFLVKTLVENLRFPENMKTAKGAAIVLPTELLKQVKERVGYVHLYKVEQVQNPIAGKYSLIDKSGLKVIVKGMDPKGQNNANQPGVQQPIAPVAPGGAVAPKVNRDIWTPMGDRAKGIFGGNLAVAPPVAIIPPNQKEKDDKNLLPPRAARRVHRVLCVARTRHGGNGHCPGSQSKELRLFSNGRWQRSSCLCYAASGPEGEMMRININKEMLLKHRFWVMLGTALIVTLTGTVYLETAVDAETYRKKLTSVFTNYKQKAQGPYQNQETIKVPETYAQTAQSLESSIWKSAYKAQEEMFKWAKPVEDEFNYFSGLYATDVKIGVQTPEGDGVMSGMFAGSTDKKFWIMKPDKNPKAKNPVKVEFYITPINITVPGETNPIPLTVALAKHAVNKPITVHYQSGRYFNDPLTEAERNTFEAYYKDQIPEILKTVNPVDEKGDGVVILRDWPWKTGEWQAEDWPDPAQHTFIRYVRDPLNLSKDIYREIWMAQENVWIQREIYHRIRAANDTISVFKEDIGFSGAGGEDKNKYYTFSNAYLDVGVMLDDKGVLTVKVKNLQAHRQKLDNMKFRVQTIKDAVPEEITVTSKNPLEPTKKSNDTYVMKAPLPGKDAQRKGVYSIEQVSPPSWGEDKNKPYFFKNAYLHVTLSLDSDNGLAVKITNLQDKIQKLDDLRFLVSMNKQGFSPEELKFSEKALKSGESFATDKPVEKKANALRSGIYGVEQLLSWKTAAVKRIDYISIGANIPNEEIALSHRTFAKPLMSIDKDIAAAPGGAAPGPGPGPGPGFPIFGPKAKGKAPKIVGDLEHGFWKERYYEVTDQFRRVPVAIVLIVDPAHVDSVLTSFNNSKFRFLINQLSINQYPESIQPKIVADNKGAAQPIGPIFMPPNARPPQGGAADQASMANVELVVHGMMTLYQRYPPRPKKL